MTNATNTLGAEILAAAAELRKTGNELDRLVAAWMETEADSWGRRGNSGEGHTFHALSIARMVNAGQPSSASPAAAEVHPGQTEIPSGGETR